MSSKKEKLAKRIATTTIFSSACYFMVGILVLLYAGELAFMGWVIIILGVITLFLGMKMYRRKCASIFS